MDLLPQNHMYIFFFLPVVLFIDLDFVGVKTFTVEAYFSLDNNGTITGLSIFL